MKAKFGIFLAAIAILAASLPAIAHHAFAAEYDADQPVKISLRVSAEFVPSELNTALLIVPEAEKQVGDG